MRRFLAATLVVLCAALTLSPTRARAADARPIQDHGDFFSPQAITAAEEISRDIKRDLGRDVLVVTFASVPKDMQPELQRKGKDQFFADWLARLGDQQRVDGVVILVTDHPGHVQVGVHKSLLAHDFTERDRDTLRDVIISRFHERQFDRGLIDGFRLIFDRMSEHQQPGSGHFAEQPTTRPISLPATTQSAQ
jgi:uncharacterized membrane protein YgcG